MKNSRFNFILAGVISAIFFGGAILGSYIPKTELYIGITAVSLATSMLIYYGYTGRKTKKNRKTKEEKEKNDILYDIVENID